MKSTVSRTQRRRIEALGHCSSQRTGESRRSYRWGPGGDAHKFSKRRRSLQCTAHREFAIRPRQRGVHVATHDRPTRRSARRPRTSACERVARIGGENESARPTVRGIGRFASFVLSRNEWLATTGEAYALLVRCTFRLRSCRSPGSYRITSVPRRSSRETNYLEVSLESKPPSKAFSNPQFHCTSDAKRLQGAADHHCLLVRREPVLPPCQGGNCSASLPCATRARQGRRRLVAWSLGRETPGES